MLMFSIKPLYNSHKLETVTAEKRASASDILLLHAHFSPDLCSVYLNPSPVSTYVGVLECVCVCDLGDSGMDLSHSMRHSSKNAIPTKPQKQPAIAQNFHIKKRGGKKGERERGEGRGKKGASEGESEEREQREVPVVAAVVLVCLPADEPQGSHGTFEAGRRAGVKTEGGGRE